jgi:hypothetical protein
MKRCPSISSRLSGAIFAAAITTARMAAAEAEPAVDVAIREAPAPRRIVTMAFSPLPLVLGKLSFEVVVVPLEHHGLVLSPFYASTTTEPIYVFSDVGQPTRLPQQNFKGFGGELGYRYYSGGRGPRGFFVGPSIILGRFTATAEDGSQTQYLHYGLAADVGHQMLIVDRVSLSLGAGLQIMKTDKPIPPQQFPAKIFASSGVLPRLLISLGVAF